MPSFRTILIGLALALASGWALAAPQGYVHDASGDVQAQVGTAAPVPIAKNQGFDVNTLIFTGANSHAVLKFEDGQVVVLKQHSSFQVQDYRYDAAAPEKGSILFSLLKGGARFVTGLIAGRNRAAFKLGTPTVTIGIRGTDFAVEMVNPLFGQVFAGEIAGTNAGGTFTAGPGQFFTVANFNSLGALIPAANVPAGVLQFPGIPVPPPTPGLPGGLTPLGGTTPGLTTGAILGLGAAAAAAAAAAGGGGGGGGVIVPTTTHHP